jgi:hypothetical protein
MFQEAGAYPNLADNWKRFALLKLDRAVGQGDFHPAVLRPALRARARDQGAGLTIAFDIDDRGIDPRLNQVVLNCLGPLQRELLVILRCADVVGIAEYREAITF